MCGSRFHGVITGLSHQSRSAFLETGSPATPLSTKTVILSTCSCLRSGIKSNSRGSLILWAKCFAVSARSSLCWAKCGSPTPTCLVVHLVVSSLSWCSRFIRNHWRWVVRVSSRVSMSKYCAVSSVPNLNTRFKNKRLFTSESSNPSVPMSIAVYLDLKSLSMCLSPSSSD